MANISPVGRVSYPHVFEPNEFQGKKNFTITLLFDKDDPGLAELKEMAKAAVEAKWPKKKPENFRSPFRDGDTEKEGSPEYEGKTYIVFKSSESRPPQVVGPSKQPLERKDFYPGCYARVSFSCYAYDTAGNRGVAFGLNNVQKVKEGERLDSSSSADSDFGLLEDSTADLF